MSSIIYPYPPGLKRVLKAGGRSGPVFPAAPPFSPTDIPELKLWLDAADMDTLTLRDSTYVAEWRDKSGEGNDFPQAVEAEQPSWASDEIDFAASLAHLTAGSNYIFSASGKLTLIALAQNPTASGFLRFIFDFGYFDGRDGYGTSYVQDNAATYAPSWDAAAFGFSLDANYHRIMHWIDLGVTTQSLYVDNVVKANGATTFALTAATIAESPTQVDGVSGPMTIGKQSSLDSEGTSFLGKIKQLLIYTKALSASERANVDAFLAAIP